MVILKHFGLCTLALIESDQSKGQAWPYQAAAGRFPRGSDSINTA